MARTAEGAGQFLNSRCWSPGTEPWDRKLSGALWILSLIQAMFG